VSNMSSRDRKILLAIVPLVLIVAYWFLLLSPKREEASKAQKDLTEQQGRLTAAKQVASQAKGAKTSFAADYGEIVRLGKAIPARVDMPSLLVQLERAAEGTDITFTKITQGERTPLAVPASTTPPATGTTPPATGTTPPATGTTPPATGTTPPATPAAGAAAPPVAAGGAPAQSAPGTATEAANTAAATSDQRNAAAEQSGVSAADTQTSTSTGGGLAVGGGAGAPTDGSAPLVSGGLETVPLELEFVGNFFHLADFFHDVKRFVHVANTNVLVNGRLITIEGVNFSSDTEIFPRIKAELTAMVYLSPLSQGVTAGATPAGPATVPTTPAAAPATTPPATTPTPAPAPTPTAAATP
jgi:Tfp pilus assembly protein PilO